MKRSYLWPHLGYLRQVYAARPVLCETWIPVALPEVRIPAGYVPDQPTIISHLVRRGLPRPIAPWDPSRSTASEPLDPDAVERYDAEVSRWEAADVAEAHPFVTCPADLVFNPVCPVCGETLPGSGDIAKRWDYHAYRQVVRSWSVAAMRRYSTTTWKPKGPEGIHLDHIVPIENGYQYGIAEEVLACPINLQELTAEENLRKGITPGRPWTELLEHYESWILDHPEWVELIAHRRQTNQWLPQSGLGRKVPSRYATTEDRDAAHRQRMASVYALWNAGKSVETIAAALGLSLTTLRGRIQLDKKYLGEASLFHRPPGGGGH